MTFIPIALFWGLALWGLVGPRCVLVYLFFASLSFGSFAVLPTAVTGGLTFTPMPMFALLLSARTLLTPQGIDFSLSSALLPRRLLLLSLFWVVAMITTVFMPRIFDGQVDIIPVRGVLPHPVPLHPSPQNFSQLAYLTISVLLIVAFARLLRDSRQQQHALNALCLGAAIAVVTGLLDFASQYVPIAPLLAPFRTATYALLTDGEVLGAKRVVGLMPEASAYGGLCIGLLASIYFFRRAIENPALRVKAAPTLLVSLVACLWLSTSSAAYVGMFVFGVFAALEWHWRVATAKRISRGRHGIAGDFWAAATISGALLLALAINPGVLDPLLSLVDRMVLQKTSSDSFSQRSNWTAVSWQAAIDTFGLGVGVGGTRASNGMVAVISNVGLLGAACYYGFIAQTLARRGPPGNGRILLNAARWAFLPGFAVDLMIGMSSGFSAFNAFTFGLVSAVAFAGGPAASSRPERPIGFREPVPQTVDQPNPRRARPLQI